MKYQTPIVWSFEAIGTRWQISFYEPLQVAKLEHLKQIVAVRINEFDAVYSRFRADSLVTKIATVSGAHEFPADAPDLFKLYRQLYEATGGAVTPLIGQALSDAGYDASYSLQPRQLNQPPAWDNAMELRGRTLHTKIPTLLDFGAAGKGYLVDIIQRLLLDNQLTKFCINAGGDLRCTGLAGFKVGLEHPNDTEQVIGVVELSDGALCGSAGNRRQWEEYTHILNPHTLRSPDHIAAVWCMAADTVTADGLTTALSFVEPEQLQASFTFDYCIVYADATMRYSEGFRTAVFQQQGAGV